MTGIGDANYSHAAVAHYRSSVSLEASVDEAFDFVRDPRNLPSFVARITEAEPLGGDRVRLTLNAGDGARTTEAAFRTHESGHKRRVEWAADSGDYHGWLEIDREGAACSVTMELNAPHVDGAEVDAALWAIKETVEAR